MSGKNPLFKSGKTIWLWWDFCRRRISAGFGKSACFRPEPEPKSGTALLVIHQSLSLFVVRMLELFLTVVYVDWCQRNVLRCCLITVKPVRGCEVNHVQKKGGNNHNMSYGFKASEFCRYFNVQGKVVAFY